MGVLNLDPAELEDQHTAGLQFAAQRGMETQHAGMRGGDAQLGGQCTDATPAAGTRAEADGMVHQLTRAMLPGPSAHGEQPGSGAWLSRGHGPCRQGQAGSEDSTISSSSPIATNHHG